MNKAQIEKTLTEWKKLHLEMEAALEPLYDLTGAAPDSPLLNAFYAIKSAHTDAVSAMVGDMGGWLDWFELENKMGERGLEASQHGKLRKVKTIKHLAALVLASSDP